MIGSFILAATAAQQFGAFVKGTATTVTVYGLVKKGSKSAGKKK